MKLSDFNYNYPPEQVAAYPLAHRDQSKMMVLDRQTGARQHRSFQDFPDFFEKGDVLVVNDSKVFPCRLKTKKETGGEVECFLVREVEPGLWECLLTASKRTLKGTRYRFSDDLEGEIVDDFAPVRHIRLQYQGKLEDILSRIGHIPLPPYIKREDERDFDWERYQTVYAAKTGSVAAPTAGFHLTDAILSRLRAKGVEIVSVTLHVGLGTFLPIRTEVVEEHAMHGEYYEISPETAEKITAAQTEKRRVSVVGTTAVRALESAWDGDRKALRSGRGYTEKFIYPPYEFQVVNRLLTNFHQPQSTLLVLVSAFAGRETVLGAYNEAIKNGYRLFSYGDCMFLV